MAAEERQQARNRVRDGAWVGRGRGQRLVSAAAMERFAGGTVAGRRLRLRRRAPVVKQLEILYKFLDADRAVSFPFWSAMWKS